MALRLSEGLGRTGEAAVIVAGLTVPIWIEAGLFGRPTYARSRRPHSEELGPEIYAAKMKIKPIETAKFIAAIAYPMMWTAFESDCEKQSIDITYIAIPPRGSR